MCGEGETPMKLAIAAQIIVLACSAPQLPAATVFYFTSSPTSWIGLGQTRTLTPSEGYDVGGAQRGSGFGNLSYAMDLGAYSPTTPPGGKKEWWNIVMVGVNGSAPGVGTHLNAERWPFQSSGHPGLDFSGNGRGNNTLAGEFYIYEKSVGANGLLTKLAVDFMQYDEGGRSNWIWGSFRINSDIPITLIPEPAAVALAFWGYWLSSAVAALGSVPDSGGS
jgi:hypothetical protein